MRAAPLLAVAVVLALLAPGLAVALPPRGPAVSFNNGANPHLWYGHALQRGFNVQASGCDPGGVLVVLNVSVETYGKGTLSQPNVCAWSALVVPASAIYQPGNLLGEVYALDNEAREGRAVGFVNLSILPWSTATVQGFPDLALLPAPELGDTVKIDLIVGSTGTVRGHRVAYDDMTWTNTLWSVTPQAGDMRLTVTFRAYAGDATILKDDAPRWIGSIRQQGLAWWQIVPLDDDGVALVNAGLLRI